MGTVTFSSTVSGMTPEEFAAFEARIIPLFSPALDKLAEGYRGVTAQSFDNEHGGLTGETAGTAEVVPAVPTPMIAQSRVRFGSHVGFVISPLPAHRIEVRSATALFNPQTTQTRPANRNSPFGPVRAVQWYQGGAESFSPDTSWYTRHIPLLEVQGAIALERFGAALQAMLAEQGATMEYEVTGADTPGLIPMP